MKPKPFDYFRPETVEDALALLDEHGAEAKVIAGGQSLGAMLNLRLVAPSVLIDISRIDALKRIDEKDGMVEIGAMVTQRQLLDWPSLAEKLPFIEQALPWVGHFQTRNRGTVCGSISHSDPSSELPLSLALLEGEVVLRSRKRRRVLKAEDFQLAMLTTARDDDELVVAVRFPVGVGARGRAFREVARRHGDFAIVAVGLVVLPDGRLRLGVAGMADTPQTIEFDGDIGEKALAEEIDAFAWRLRGFEDIHATARYRRDLLRRLAPELVSEVRQCVQ